MSRRYGRLLPSRTSEPFASSRPTDESPANAAGVVAAPVTLHVYHVTGLDAVRRVNKVLRAFGTGAFHAAVEVYGEEWSFGFTDDGGSGVFACPPRKCEAHAYLKSVPMGTAPMRKAEVLAIIQRLAEEWQGDDYDLLHCNCCHFSEELCRRLGVGPLPRWVTNLAGTGAAVGDHMHTVAESAQAAAAKAREAQEGARETFAGVGGASLRRRSADSRMRLRVCAAVVEFGAKVRQRARGALARRSDSCRASSQSRSYRRCH